MKLSKIKVKRKKSQKPSKQIERNIHEMMIIRLSVDFYQQCYMPKDNGAFPRHEGLSPKYVKIYYLAKLSLKTGVK